MITDLDLVDLVALSYRPDASWDHVYRGQADDDLTVCVKRLGDTAIIAYPGTTDVEGWLRDFEAFSVEIRTHPQLGPLHAGFWSGMDAAIADINTATAGAGRAIVVGHSLGAARATEHAGMLTANGSPPAAVVVFGEPKAGMAPLATLLAGVPIRSYRNGDDPVPLVPFTIPGFPYQHPRPLLALDAPPLADDPWGRLLGWHHIQNYYNGIQALASMPAM